jgi:Rad3-related DNA helicase
VKRNDSDAIALLHQRGVASPEDAMEIGESAQICPHELTLDASRAVDLVVGDMNYLFDPHAMIRRHFPENAKQWVVVVDEAHGLVDRVRRSLSPVISTRELDEALVQCAGDVPWSDLITKLSNFVRRPLLESDRYRDGLALAEMPTLDLGDLLEACEDLSLALSPREGVSVVVAQLRRLVDHLRWREGESEDAFVDVSGERGRVSSLGSLCIDPSGWIAKQMRSFGGCVVLSATLRPERFFVDNFGIRALKPRVFDAGTPFPPENQLVLRMGGISTRYKDREASAGRIAAVISSVIAAVHSGVAVYFSSYAAMDSVVPLVGELNCELLMQRRAMTAEAREAILDRMKSTEGVCALFAVLGGSFAEAVDLPSGVLDAVVVVGPGLPPVGLEQTLLQRHYQQRFSEGFLYASVVPGVSKVVQAAGRLIRRAEDRGAIVLIGERFQEPMFYDQFPSWWVPVDVEDPTVYLSGHFAQEA